MRGRKLEYLPPEIVIDDYPEDEDIICNSLTDDGIGEEDDFGGTVGGGGGDNEWT